MTSTPRLAFIGTGSMGGSLLSGVLSSGLDAEAVVATTHSAASAARTQESLGVRTLSLEADPRANAKAVPDADFVFLGVKPWMIVDTLTDLAPDLRPGTTVVSMAAGKTIAQIAALVPEAHVVRIMPNTPSSIGSGVVALSPDADVPAEAVHTLETLLSGAGRVFTLPEDEIDAMIGVSGSGVAYFFLLAEAMVDAGVELGLDRETARNMVVATAEGAGKLLATDPDPAKLRSAVTSKGGTTYAALSTFEDAGIRELVVKAARAAHDRSIEMAAE